MEIWKFPPTTNIIYQLLFLLAGYIKPKFLGKNLYTNCNTDTDF